MKYFKDTTLPGNPTIKHTINTMASVISVLSENEGKSNVMFDILRVKLVLLLVNITDYSQ